MKSSLPVIALALTLVAGSLQAHSPTDPYDDLSHWANCLKSEIQSCLHEQQFEKEKQELQLIKLEKLIAKSYEDETYDVRLLFEKDRMQRELEETNIALEFSLLKIRYQKSIELIKLLYEKVLALDHHFTSLRAHQEVLRMANPHSFPEFAQTQDVIQKKMKKKYSFELPEMMISDPYISVAYSLVGTILSAGITETKRDEFEKIACILDFTVRMKSDLNIIYFETEYLKDANDDLKNNCEKIFEESLKTIGYSQSLKTCREEDDWEVVYQTMEDYFNYLEFLNSEGVASKSPTNLEVNMKFSIDRVVRFLDSYSGFAQQGNNYYQKFNKIVSSYENKEICSDELQGQYSGLQQDIEQTMDKFNYAYNLPEITGSQLKSLLYGEVEYLSRRP